MTTVPGSRSWPSKRLSSSICCWWSNGLNSGDVASRFLSSRSRANLSRRSFRIGTSAHSRPTAVAIDLEQVGLADDLHRRRARLLGDQRHLAEQRALVQARRARRPCCGRRARPPAPRRSRRSRTPCPSWPLPDDDVAVAGAHQAQRLDRHRETPRAAARKRTARAETAPGTGRTRTGRRPDRARGARRRPDRPRPAGIGAISASRSTGACRAANFASAGASCE